MLTDPVEIEIISRARQKNVRDPRRSRAHFERILQHFFAGRDIAGDRVLDLGPGQYDFAAVAGRRGAVVEAIDNDPAVLELGRHRGLAVVDGNIRAISPDMFGQRFDGLFCKFSINAFWFWDAPDAHAAFLERLLSLAEPQAWLWIAPWNGVPRGMPDDPDLVRRTLDIQSGALRAAGCEAVDLGPDLARYLGVNGAVANNVLFLRGLTCDDEISARCR